MRTGSRYAFRDYNSEGVIPCILAEIQRQAEEWESFIVKDSGIGKNSGVPIGGVGKEMLKVG